MQIKNGPAQYIKMLGFYKLYFNSTQFLHESATELADVSWFHWIWQPVAFETLNEQ